MTNFRKSVGASNDHDRSLKPEKKAKFGEFLKVNYTKARTHTHTH